MLLLLLVTSVSCLFTGPAEVVKRLDSTPAAPENVIQEDSDPETAFMAIYRYGYAQDGPRTRWKEAGIIARTNIWTEWTPVTCCIERTEGMRTLRGNYAINATWSWGSVSVEMEFPDVEAILGASVRRIVSEASSMICGVTRAGAIVQIQVQIEMAKASFSLRDCSQDATGVQCTPWSDELSVSAPTGGITASCREVSNMQSSSCKIPGLLCEFTALGDPLYQTTTSV